MRHSSRLLPVLCLLATFTGCDSQRVDATHLDARVDAGDAGDEVKAVRLKSDMDAGRDDSAAASAPDVPTAVEIIDPRGFGQPMVAARAELPGNWQTQGGVTWDRSSECVTNHLRLQWRAMSPDGRRSIELMPGLNWQLAGTDIDMNPCRPLALGSTREFLETVAQRYPNARVLSYRDRPDLVPPPAPPTGNGPPARVFAGELLITYPGESGPVRELLSSTLTVTELQGNICVGAPIVLAYRVVNGDPDPAVSDRFMKSLKADGAWLDRSTQVAMRLIDQISARQRQGIATWHAGQMARINARGAADRAQIRMQTNREVAQIYSNTWSSGMATDERIQRRTLEGIGEYNTYADPAGGNDVRASTDYNRVIRTEDGNYISTNDPYLQPAGSEELERVP